MAVYSPYRGGGGTRLLAVCCKTCLDNAAFILLCCAVHGQRAKHRTGPQLHDLHGGVWCELHCQDAAVDEVQEAEVRGGQTASSAAVQ